MSVLSGNVSIPGTHNLAQTFVGAAVRAKLREHDTDSGLDIELGARFLRRAGHAVLVISGKGGVFRTDF